MAVSEVVDANAADQEFIYITMQMPDQNIVAGQLSADFYKRTPSSSTSMPQAI